MKYLGAISDPKDLVNKGYVDGAIPTKVSDLTNDSGFITATGVDEKIDEIEIGVKNLLPTSKNLKLFALESATYVSKTVTDDYLAVTRLSGNNTSNLGVYYDIQVEANTDYVLSVEVSNVSGNTLRNAIGHMAPAGTGKSSWIGCVDYELIRTDGRYIRKFNTGITTTARIYFAMMYEEGASNTVQLSNIKLEKGNKATGWTPAPEDIEAEVDALNANTNLTLTRTEQDHVNATQFGRLSAVKRGNMLTLSANLEVVYGNGFSGFETIGKITGWASPVDGLVQVPAQSDGSKVVSAQVTTDGYIKLFSGTSFTGAPWFRFTITVPST